jgi:hypothetical protein
MGELSLGLFYCLLYFRKYRYVHNVALFFFISISNFICSLTDHPLAYKLEITSSLFYVFLQMLAHSLLN